MNRIIFVLTTLLISVSAYSQTVEQLKKKSEEKSRGSGNNSGNQSSGNNNSDNDACMSDCLSGCLTGLFDINRPARQVRQAARSKERQDSRVQKRDLKGNNNSSDLPFETMNISLRGSFAPGTYHVFVPEISGGKGHFAYSARVLTIAERRLGEMEYFSTLDVQPLQISFVNHSNFLFKAGIGAMVVTTTDQLSFEFTTNFKWRIGKKIDMGIEGRMATNHGIVRQEASTQINYALWQKNNKQFLVGINGMISEYYQSVDVNALSLSTGFRF